MSHTQKDKPVEEIDLQYTSILHLRAPLSLSLLLLKQSKVPWKIAKNDQGCFILDW